MFNNREQSTITIMITKSFTMEKEDEEKLNKIAKRLDRLPADVIRQLIRKEYKNG